MMNNIKNFIDINFSDILDIVDFINAKDYDYLNSNKAFYENNKDFILFYQKTKKKEELVDSIQEYKKDFFNSPDILNTPFIEDISVLNVLFTEENKLNDIYSYIKKGFPLEVQNRNNRSFLENFNHYLNFMNCEEDITLLKDIALCLHEKGYFKKDKEDVKKFLLEMIKEERLPVFEMLVNNGLDIDNFTNNLALELSTRMNGSFDSPEKQKIYHKIFTVFFNTDKDIFYHDTKKFISNFTNDSKNVMFNIFTNIQFNSNPDEESSLLLQELYFSALTYFLNTKKDIPKYGDKTFEPVLDSCIEADAQKGCNGIFSKILNKFTYEQQEKILTMGNYFTERLSDHKILSKVLFHDYEGQVEYLLSTEYYKMNAKQLKIMALDCLDNLNSITLLHFLIKRDDSLLKDTKFVNYLFENIVATDRQYHMDSLYLDSLKVQIENQLMKNSFPIAQKCLHAKRL